MDRSDVCSQFLDTVPYDLYPFQEEALLSWFESEGGLLVTAPTGMGKTLIAEAAIYEALATNERLYYTTPLIALTDQKFREFQDKAEAWGFPRDRVGMITGNRRVNPDAPVRVVVAEILLNHLLAGEEALHDARAVVMDEFHFFNDFERGIVWELSLVLLPQRMRLMLLSATVGNPVEFVEWLRRRHGRGLKLIQSDQRLVPLEFIWVADKLLTEHLPTMVSDDDALNRAPALVFCFNRDECWEVAERLKGLKLMDPAARGEIERHLEREAFSVGAGVKLKQMLIRGVGVHHAGILPRYKQAVEELFHRKLIPFVVCTETLAAGINLPARSVVLSTLMKGKRGEKKLVAPSSAHQMFGRAGRPQFDTRGYVYVMAHEDDARIAKWRAKYEKIDPQSKDPTLMRVRKQLERKKPTRRKTVQYWTEGQLKMLIEAGPAKLYSRTMIPYQVLIYLLTATGTLQTVRDFLTKRFNTPERIQKFQDQLDRMIENLATLGYLSKNDDDGRVTLHDTIHELLNFRSIDPLYGVFLSRHLTHGSYEEKVLALESTLPLPTAIERKVALPETDPGPLQTNVLLPALIERGLLIAHPDGRVSAVASDADEGDWAEDEGFDRPPSFPEMLGMLFEDQLTTPENVFIQPKCVAGGVFELGGDFHKYVRSRDLVKNEGLILRHLLRLTILAGEFLALSDGDPDYERIGDMATQVCTAVDPRYTDRFLESRAETQSLPPV